MVDYTRLNSWMNHCYNEHIYEDACNFMEHLIEEHNLQEEAMWVSYSTDDECLDAYDEYYGDYVRRYQGDYDTYAEYLLNEQSRYIDEDTVVRREMPETWVRVSRWLANRLPEHDEKVFEWHNNFYWGRVGTGVAIVNESAFVAIFRPIWERDYNPNQKPRVTANLIAPGIHKIDSHIQVMSPDNKQVLNIEIAWDVTLDRAIVKCDSKDFPVLFHIEGDASHFYRPTLVLRPAEARLLQRIVEQEGIDDNMPKTTLAKFRRMGLVTHNKLVTKVAKHLINECNWYQSRIGDETMRFNYRRLHEAKKEEVESDE